MIELISEMIEANKFIFVSFTLSPPYIYYNTPYNRYSQHIHTKKSVINTDLITIHANIYVNPCHLVALQNNQQTHYKHGHAFENTLPLSSTY